METLATPHNSIEPVLAQLLRLVADPAVTDVLVNGPAQVWVDRGSGLEAVAGLGVSGAGVAGAGVSGEQLVQVAFTLAQLADRHVDLANPMGDFVLGPSQLPPLAGLGVESLRVHVVLQSAVSPETLISLRVHRAGGLGLEQLIHSGFCNSVQAGQLASLAAGGSNFLVAGPAGSGKTTLLRALLAQQSELRTVVIEDTAELLPIVGHFVALQCRQANTEGRGLVDAAELLRQALRMRPDRLVVGEIRGTEVGVLLQALNTGHRGSAATLHANSAVAVPSRLLGLALQAGIPESAFWLAAPVAFEFVVQLGRGADGTRQVTEIRSWNELVA